jgi:thioredoxin 1
MSVNQQTFEKEVLRANEIVIVHFWAPWCGLCRLINPILLKFQSEENQRKLKLISINADENLQLSNTYRLKSLPTILVFTQGNLIQRLEGFHNREDLHNSLEQLIRGIFSSQVMGI